MNTTAKATIVQRIMRNMVLCGLLGVMLVGMTGCEQKGNQSEEDICAFMENVAQSTEKCLANRNVNLARDTWSDLSEQGLNATNQGAEEIGKAIGSLAVTYGELVKYCDSGEETDRQAFLSSFESAAQSLSDKIAQEGFDTTVLSQRIEEVCSE